MITPAGFMSYVRLDDQHESGRLSEFCKRLSGEMRMQTGEDFYIFQDRNDIAWGQQWKQRIEDSLDDVSFLFPILTPGFFKSQACRSELERFLDREKKLERNDLIFPVYYLNCPILNNEVKREADPLAKTIAERQFEDWRELRFEQFTSQSVRKMLAKMAAQIADVLEREKPAHPPVTISDAAAADIKQATDSESEIGKDREESVAQSPESTRGPTHKTEPPTLVVDALHRGDHPSLTEGLKAAKPGDRILVRPGLYREGVVIDKPVEIIGDGELEEIVIEATGKDTILFQANMSRISNLTLRQTGGGKWFCVDIAQGRLDLEGCDITSQSISCVAIHGSADPRLRSNRIHGGKSSGVHVYENGQGTLEDNDIFGNVGPGVTIYGGGNPTLRSNRIYDGMHNGVLIYGNSQGTLEDNDIFGNALAGVAIREGGNPTLRGNRIHDQKQSGVHVYKNGQGTLEDNDIFGNAFAGVAIKEGGNPTLRGNRIHDGKQSGVLVNTNGLGMLEDNDIFGNARAGVKIREGGNPILRSNRISKNSYEAIWVHDGGQGTFEDNDLRGNEKGAWDISPDCQDKVKRARNQE